MNVKLDDALAIADEVLEDYEGEPVVTRIHKLALFVKEALGHKCPAEYFERLQLTEGLSQDYIDVVLDELDHDPKNMRGAAAAILRVCDEAEKQRPELGRENPGYVALMRAFEAK